MRFGIRSIPSTLQKTATKVGATSQERAVALAHCQREEEGATQQMDSKCAYFIP